MCYYSNRQSLVRLFNHFLVSLHKICCKDIQCIMTKEMVLLLKCLGCVCTIIWTCECIWSWNRRVMWPSRSTWHHLCQNHHPESFWEVIDQFLTLCSFLLFYCSLPLVGAVSVTLKLHFQGSIYRISLMLDICLPLRGQRGFLISLCKD